MRKISLEQRIIESVVELLRISETRLPIDIIESLKKAYNEETETLAKTQLKAILDNIKYASEKNIPICQDTGLITFYVKLGDEFPIRSKLNSLLIEAVKRATEEVPLRPNAVNPWTGKNSGDNTGEYIPYIHYELVPGDSLEISVMPKGGGSSYVAKLYSIPPAEKVKGLKKAVINAVYDAGPKPCPPIIVGVGVGGTEDLAMILAKKALLRPINIRNEDENIAKLEEELLGLLNSLEIGAMGFGGKTTVLGVNIEWAHRHPATFLVGIAIGCWAMRRGTLIIHKDGSAEIISHGVKIQ
ncbi:MAG: fumarate hydratase [Candidatus Njordarchaeales archaeon]|mgnify:CR=1 FL=1